MITNLRQAQESDYEPLMNLYNLFVEEDRYSNFNNDSFHKLLNDKNYFIYVLEDQQKLIGFATFSVRFIVRYKQPIAQLEELFVKEEHRNKGLGKKLINQVADKARELDCYRLYIESHIDRTTAHAVYEKLGFSKDGYYFKINF